MKIQVFNVLGQIMLEQDVRGRHTKVDIGNVLKGIYWVRVSHPNGELVKKLVIN